MIGILFAVIIFACVAYLGVELGRAFCSRVKPLDGAPPSSEPPVAVLVAGGAVLGALLVTQGASPPQIVIGAIVVLALAACWASDSLRGIVPDVFTLIPLALVLIVSLSQGERLVIVSTLIAFVPFAVAALATKGRGMGWGDAKLVALAGAALGAPLAMLAMIVACLGAVAGYKIKRIQSGPIAFAPYIVVAVGAALPIGVAR